jgi:hypothetical protein
MASFGASPICVHLLGGGCVSLTAYSNLFPVGFEQAVATSTASAVNDSRTIASLSPDQLLASGYSSSSPTLASEASE